MNQTNFDKYLDEQLKDPAFAAKFEQAGREWDLAFELARRSDERHYSKDSSKPRD